MMERLTVKWTDKVYDALDPVDILDNEYSKTNYNKLLTKLGEYEDLEERLNGVSVKQVVDGFIKTVENQTNEEYEHGRILTNAEADKWNEYKRLEEQGLLLRLPCRVGTSVYMIGQDCGGDALYCRRGDCEGCSDLYNFVEESKFEAYMLEDIGNTVFLTQEEAEQKLKEMEND